MDKSLLYISFAVYLLGMIAVGIYFYRRSRLFADYILAGRGLNYWVTSLSAQASDMSGWLLMGLPGYAFVSGTEALWIAVGLAIGTWLNWQFVAKRLRVYSELAGNAITIPNFLSNRYKDKTHIIRLVTAVFILLFFLIYTASGFVAGAKLFTNLLDINYHVALIISALVIVSYTFLGGFNAVSWTDFVQGTIMFIAVIFVPVIGIYKLGGIENSIAQLNKMNSNFLNPLTAINGNALSLITVMSLVGWGFGYFGQPHILSRFMAIRSANEIIKAKRLAIIWVVISLFFAVVIGMVGNLWYGGVLEDPEKVFIHLVEDHFPGVLSGFLLAAVLAAVMSTADSQLLVTSSSIAEDVYRVFLRKNATDKELLLVSRLSVVVVALFALLIASDPESKVLDLVAFAWGGFGASLGPAILFSLFWKNTSRKGVIAGIVVGGLVTVIWKMLSGGWFDMFEIIPGFVFSSLTIFIISLLTQDKEMILLTRQFSKFEKAMKN